MPDPGPLPPPASVAATPVPPPGAPGPSAPHERAPGVDARLALVAVPVVIAGIIVAVVQFTGGSPDGSPDGAAAVGAGTDTSSAADPPGSCTDPSPLTVSALPEDAGLVRALDQAWQDSGAASCVTVDVLTDAASSDAAPALVIRRSPEVQSVPVVGAVGDPAVIASTLGVIGADTATAAQLGWPDAEIAPGALISVLVGGEAAAGIGLADPRTTVSSLLGLTALATAPLGQPLDEIPGSGVSDPAVQGGLFAVYNAVTLEASTQPELLDAAAGTPTQALLVDEAAVARFNAGDPAQPLAPVYPTGASPLIEITATVVDRDDDVDAVAAAQSLIEFADTDAGRDALASLGYRDADGALPEEVAADLAVAADGSAIAGQDAAVGPPAGELLATMTFGWNGATNPGRYILAIDVSGSMAQEVPGTGRTKLEFAQQAAIEAVQVAPRSGEIGLWEFSTAIEGNQDYRELVPNGLIDDVIDNRTRREALISAIEGLVPRDDTGLYDTALASFRRAKEQYQAGEPNLVVLVTDGRNEDTTGGVELGPLLETLRAEQDPAAPVQITTIAYGADADTEALAQIAEATGGLAYVSPNPAQIGQVLVAAFSGGRAGLLPGEATAPAVPGN